MEQVSTVYSWSVLILLGCVSSLLKGELAEVDVVLIGCDKVNELSELRLERHVVEKFEEETVVRLLSEMLLEQVVNGGLEHEGIVDGNVVHTLDFVPAWLASASDRLVHHVVGDEEVCLQLYRVRSRKGQKVSWMRFTSVSDNSRARCTIPELLLSDTLAPSIPSFSYRLAQCKARCLRYRRR